MQPKSFSLVLLAMFASLILAACGGGTAATPTQAPAPAAEATAAPAAPTAAPAEPTAAPAEPTAAPAEPTAAPAAGGSSLGTLEKNAANVSQELADAFAGKFKGTKVTMTGPFTGEDANKFAADVKEFEDKTGITIEYEGSKEFEATIAARVQGGNAPDIVDFPQPGLAATFAKQGKIVDVTKFIKPEWLKQNYTQSYLDIATLDGQSGKIMAGVWHRAFPKSLVWYPKAAFDAAGYKIPTTWAELTALQDQIVKDGDTPWCIGIESGAATGWPATDWTEEMMLRTTSLDNYDKWVKGELKFTDPIVKNAVKIWSDIWFNDKYVFGGRAKIVTTNFGDAPKPMFEKPDPKCWLHRQGSFITSFFPKDAKPGTDYAVFYFPPFDDQHGKPVLFSGDMMSMFNDRPEVRAVEAFFSSGASVEGWVKAGGATSPHKDSSLDWYTNDIDKQVADILQKAESVRFDGSDLMPGVVGAGTFWKGMTDYVAGTVDLDKAMEEIQAGWANVK
ncbi:MAG: carbohydrate ABC transporter substrate-binding protein [Chloroflexi bacterium SZAS-1]|nr:carbohydrate ABC transporter substrate-binding protein [Chloroflexi bacterium SZAS-1]